MKVPFLKNFRRGFATNSSSSHSFVYMKEAQPEPKYDSTPYNEFQWNDFRLDSLKEKLFYALTSRIGNRYSWGDGPSEEDVDNAYDDFGSQYPELSREEFREALEGSVDHESLGLIDPDTARDPHVVIFGGNDNDGYSEERARVIANDEVDWSRTTMEYGDVELFDEEDEEAWEALERSGMGYRRKRKTPKPERTYPKPLYHINPKTGNPGICRAEIRHCPHGGEDEHYTSKAAARAAYEAANS